MKIRKRKKTIKGLWEDIPPLVRLGIVVGVTGVSGFVAYKFVRKVIDKGKMRTAIKEFKNQTVQDLNINLAEIAQQIYDALRLAYPKYDPRSWKEDEEAATLAVLKVPKTFIGQLENVYRQNYSRSLRNDLQTYLDEYWNQVSYLFM